MQHLALVMDGNRRWARSNNLSSKDGHRKGQDSARLAVEFCIKRQIKYLSLYAFSLENFKRSQQEQDDLFTILLDAIDAELDELQAQGVCIRFIGDRSAFPPHLLKAIQRAEAQTEQNSTLYLSVLFCYGGQQELVHAVKKIVQQVQEGQRNIDDIDQQCISNALWTSGIPDPDLIVRPSGVRRLSNFLLYQAAYSEYAFVDWNWPDLTETHLQQCLDDYRAVKRNYGQ